MATKKSAGSAKNLKDSQPKYLGVKRADGQLVKTGEIIVRQRGTKIEAGTNTNIGKDHTIFSAISGKVSFGTMRKIRFDGNKVVKKVVRVLPV
jgi:large subunit ribosomal protein L27